LVPPMYLLPDTDFKSSEVTTNLTMLPLDATLKGLEGKVMVSCVVHSFYRIKDG
jgi:hypothetical protein